MINLLMNIKKFMMNILINFLF